MEEGFPGLPGDATGAAAHPEEIRQEEKRMRKYLFPEKFFKKIVDRLLRRRVHRLPAARRKGGPTS